MKWMKSLFSGLGMLPDEEVPNNFPCVLSASRQALETIQVHKFLLLKGQLTVAEQWARHGENYPAGEDMAKTTLQVSQTLQNAQHSKCVTTLGAGERSMLTAQHSKIP